MGVIITAVGGAENIINTIEVDQNKNGLIDIYFVYPVDVVISVKKGEGICCSIDSDSAIEFVKRLLSTLQASKPDKKISQLLITLNKS